MRFVLLALWLSAFTAGAATPERVRELEAGLDDDPSRVWRITAAPPGPGVDPWTHEVRNLLAASTIGPLDALDGRIEAAQAEATARRDDDAACLLQAAAVAYQRRRLPAETVEKSVNEQLHATQDRPWCLARLELAVGQMHSADGRLARSIAALQRAVDLAESAGDMPMLASGLSELAWVYKQARDGEAGLQASMDAAKAGLRHVDRHRERYLASTLLHNLAGVYLTANRLTEAQHYAEESMALVTSIESKQGVPYLARLLGRIDLLRGRPLQSLKHYTEARSAFAASGDEAMVVIAATGMARAQLELRRPLDARRTLLEVEPLLARKSSAEDRVGFYATATDVHAAVGDARATATAAKAWAQASQERDMAEGRRAASELRERFDSERTAAENQRLRESREANIARERWLMLTLALSALLVTGLVWHVVQQRRVQSQLHVLAHRDALTGLPNRRAILALAQQLASSRLERDHPACIALLDIDHFKRVNDQHGHDVGDQALQLFARVCADALRNADALGRLGGEEFLLVMPATPPQDATVVFERIQKSLLDAPVVGMAPDDRLTCSMGCALLQPGGDVHETVRRADAALYEAKAQGRDQLKIAA